LVDRVAGVLEAEVAANADMEPSRYIACRHNSRRHPTSCITADTIVQIRVWTASCCQHDDISGQAPSVVQKDLARSFEQQCAR